MEKVVVFGSRDFTNDFQASLIIEAHVRELIPKDATIMHGNCRGTDRIAAAAAKRHGCTVVPFDADWDQYGRAAGPIRNREMLDAEPDWALGFWNGTSKGTKDVIDECEKRGIRCEVVRID